MYNKTFSMAEKICLSANFISFLCTLYFILKGNTLLSVCLLFLLSASSLCWILCRDRYDNEHASPAVKEDYAEILDISTKEYAAKTAELEKKNDELEAELAGLLDKLSALKEQQTVSLLPLPNNTSLPCSDIRPVLDSVLNSCSSKIKRKELTVNIAAESDFFVSITYEHLYVLLLNVIDNAIKYLPPKGNLTITLSAQEKDALLIVKDNGLGLPSEETSRIFELNYQGSNKLSGSGLGLAQAKAITDACHGSISASSTVKNGMSIFIRLPLDQPESEQTETA